MTTTSKRWLARNVDHLILAVISIVLFGSIFVLAGCQGYNPFTDNQAAQQAQVVLDELTALREAAKAEIAQILLDLEAAESLPDADPESIQAIEDRLVDLQTSIDGITGDMETIETSLEGVGSDAEAFAEGLYIAGGTMGVGWLSTGALVLRGLFRRIRERDEARTLADGFRDHFQVAAGQATSLIDNIERAKIPGGPGGQIVLNADLLKQLNIVAGLADMVAVTRKASGGGANTTGVT